MLGMNNKWYSGHDFAPTKRKVLRSNFTLEYKFLDLLRPPGRFKAFIRLFISKFYKAWEKFSENNYF